MNYSTIAIPSLFLFLRHQVLRKPKTLPFPSAKPGPSPQTGESKPVPNPSEPQEAPLPDDCATPDAVTILMGQTINKYGKNACWSATSQQTLRTARSLLCRDPDQAFALLRSLPEEERVCFCKLIYQEIKGESHAKIAGILGWYYFNFGGEDAESIKKGQAGVTKLFIKIFAGLGVPATGVLDDATKVAMERESGLIFWKPTLRRWGLS